MEKAKYDVFLSHATPDKPVVEDLARRLKAQKIEPWLDKWNLIPGEPWQEAIEKALEECAACAVCLGPSGTGPWQNEEMRAAIDARVSDRSRTFRVIPVLLPHSERGEPSRLPAFLRATTWVEFRGTLDDEKALHRLLSGIRGVSPGADPGEAVAEGAQPYRGLQVFDVADAPFFFGREALTEWLLDKLRTDRSGNRFLAIVGPSGSGKSSLARAGLAAALKRGEIPGSDAWQAAICKPGAQPLESLAIALSSSAHLGDSPSAVLNLIRDLGANPSLLHLTTRLSLRDAPADRRLVVLVDQFEEVFTLCPDEAQRQAIIANLLHAATAADGQTVIVLTLRADFYGRCAAYPDLATAVSDRQSLVGPMTRDELRSAIERPAYLAGCELEGGLTDLLLNEVESQPNSLPLLEHALLQIWQRREGGRRLTIAAYREIGGVAGALEKHAEEVYSGFTDEEKEACRLIFLRLVQVDEQGRATKRRLGLNELPGEGVVSHLTDARLLTTDQERQPTVELAHEALLANWERLKKWIGDDRDALRTRRRLDEAVAEWIGKDRDSSFLLEGGRLAQAEEWAERHPGEMGQAARDFLSASIAARDQEGRRLKAWTVASAAMAVLAIAGALTVFLFWRASERQRKVDLAGHLAEQSIHERGSDPMLSLLLSIKAVRLAEDGGQPHLPSAETALRSALSQSRGVPLPTGKIRAASFSAEGRLLALAGTDGVVSIWDMAPAGGPTKIAILPAGPLSNSVRRVAISSKGQWIVIADQNGNSRLFRMDGAKSLSNGAFVGEDWLAANDPFSPDGHWLLTRDQKSSWKIRDLTQPGQPIKATLEMNPQALAFSSDSRWLAGAEPGGLRIWDLRPLGSLQASPPQLLNPNIIKAFQDVDGITALAFSSDSQWVVAEERTHAGIIAETWRIGLSPAQDSPASLTESPFGCGWNPMGPNLWDLSLASRVKILARCTEAGRFIGPVEITAVALAPKGRLALADNWHRIHYLSDSNSHIFDVNAGDFQRGPVKFLSLYGQRLVSQGEGEAPRVFDEQLTGLEPVTSDDRFVLRAFSLDGLQLRWYPPQRTLLLVGPHGSWPLTYTEEGTWLFSPDSRWLATVGHDRRPLVWHLDVQGKPSLPISFQGRYAHSGNVTSLAFSPDGHWLATGDAKGESRLWDLRAPASDPKELVNHRGSVTALAFNQDGHLLATAGEDGVVRISKIADAQAPRPIPASPGNRGEPVTALAFLSDDRLAIGSFSRIMVWKSGQADVALESTGTGTRVLLSSPRGSHLASTGDRDTEIWYPQANGDLLTTPVLITSSIPNKPLIGFTADGNHLETYDAFGLLRRWELRADELLATACKAVGRNLTAREWRAYIHSENYQEREPCPKFPKAYD